MKHCNNFGIVKRKEQGWFCSIVFTFCSCCLYKCFVLKHFGYSEEKFNCLIKKKKEKKGIDNFALVNN